MFVASLVLASLVLFFHCVYCIWSFSYSSTLPLTAFRCLVIHWSLPHLLFLKLFHFSLYCVCLTVAILSRWWTFKLTLDFRKSSLFITLLGTFPLSSFFLSSPIVLFLIYDIQSFSLVPSLTILWTQTMVGWGLIALYQMQVWTSHTRCHEAIICHVPFPSIMTLPITRWKMCND